ncbi:hypothetical protein BH11ARM1_BH11ARM1_15690 [soil metagenome]
MHRILALSLLAATVLTVGCNHEDATNLQRDAGSLAKTATEPPATQK